MLCNASRQQRLDRVDVAADGGQRVVGRDDHGQHVGASAVAVHEDLAHRRVAAVGRLQLGDGDELALRQLEDVVAAVDVGQLVGSDLGEHVTGVVPAVGVEQFGRHLGALVVAGDGRVRLDPQFAAGMRPVGGEVAELGDVDQLVVE